MLMWMTSIAAGFVLDSMWGDPRCIPHPVVFIGKLISFMERVLRKLAGNRKYALIMAGIAETLIVLSVTAAVPFLILRLAGNISIWLEFLLSSIMCWQILAAKSLKTESMKVYAALESHDTEAARNAVSMIVGRDTEELSEEGIIKAAVETVAENTLDGVTAPLLYLFLGGPVIGFLYKAVNTMDSMIGYKNVKYCYFGKFAARLDDVLNYIPSRITAMAMIAVCPFLNIIERKKGTKSGGYNQKESCRIWRRDGRKHASPNSGQTEAACAGALGVSLAGDASYGGVLYKKETIGDSMEMVASKHIVKAIWLMYASSILILIVLCILVTAITIGRWFL